MATVRWGRGAKPRMLPTSDEWNDKARRRKHSSSASLLCRSSALRTAAAASSGLLLFFLPFFYLHSYFQRLDHDHGDAADAATNPNVRDQWDIDASAKGAQKLHPRAVVLPLRDEGIPINN